MRIATWNVNSVRARLTHVTDWLRTRQPDVLCMQETKVADPDFPRAAIEDEGYNVVAFGEKSYNGVAIAARWPIDDVVRGLPGDPERRLLAARVRDFSIVAVYVPNGQAIGSDKFRGKLDWLRRLRQFLDAHADPHGKVAVLGDFNITFDDRDVWDPIGMREQLHCSAPEREALRQVMAFGLHDALRRFHEEPGIFTWWDYRGAGLLRNEGMRIDHVLLSDAALAACTATDVDPATRHWAAASDHAPVLATFAPA